MRPVRPTAHKILVKSAIQGDKLLNSRGFGEKYISTSSSGMSLKHF